MENYLEQGRSANLYNYADASCPPSLNINTSFPLGVPLEASSSQSSHSTTGSWDSGLSDFSSPLSTLATPVTPVGIPYQAPGNILQPIKSNTKPSRPPKMSSGYRPSGSVSATGGQQYICLAGNKCEYRTDRHTDLKRHYKAKHPSSRDEVFQCSYRSCTKEFKRKDHLRDHCKRVHYRDLPVDMGGTGRRLSR